MKMHMHSEQHYYRFALMMVLSFACMFALMYAMVDIFGNVYSSLNQFYMAGLMTMPMAIIELAVMGFMYPNKKANGILICVATVLFVLCWIGIRGQIGISDQQFLRSMIPHHAGALLMCEKVDLKDPEIQALCKNIIKGQQEEIDWMRAKLK
jgi:hypothetical protein